MASVGQRGEVVRKWVGTITSPFNKSSRVPCARQKEYPLQDVLPSFLADPFSHSPPRSSATARAVIMSPLPPTSTPLVDFGQKSLLVSALSIAFNPTFWK
ncbi:hypothetical protein VTK73DRAFT_6196 [Phialemonium thermophilum]|uniref:Uncharacterized protein n=1 Tax=Phialemonium thermophilum TaxID=223376 RepID=A0ABR3UZV4_9PEZI